jgi:hypothetical protein
MSVSLLDRAEALSNTTTTPAQRLRTTMAAVRVSFTWFGVKKSLTPEQRATAAEAFDADSQLLSAGKKLLDTRHAAYKAVTAIRTKITDFTRGISLPFPEPGVRLIKQEAIDEFAATMADSKVELEDAVTNLDRHFDELKHAARERLGSLFNSDDYPESLRGLFDVSFDFPNIEPPGYLVALNPLLYEQEQTRVSARFEEAVRLAEEAFLAEFGKLVAHLGERLAGSNDDGTTKVFRDSAIGNLVEFFDRFRQLNVRSNAQLDALVAEAQRIVRGVEPQDLRDSNALRQRVASEMSRVESALDNLLIDRPRRKILRGAAQREAS